MQTGFMQEADVWAKKTPKKYVHFSNPEYVAEKALKDAEKWKDISVYGWYPKLLRFCSFIIPDKWVMKYWLRQQDL
jgi:short-subunit dehydrogenase